MSQDVVQDKHQLPKDTAFDGSISPELVKLIAELVYELLQKDIWLEAERTGRQPQLRKQW
ncbi:MAG: hypothetical protein KDD89_09690 [Anaerolineales bacterium]|nr:hypothetical protein [Anaerolineales bacterium]